MTPANDEPTTMLPSRFQLGEYVRTRYFSGPISGVMFRAGKVYYEIGGVQHDSCDVSPVLRDVA